MVIQALWNEAGSHMQRAGMMYHYKQTNSTTICENKSTKLGCRHSASFEKPISFGSKYLPEKHHNLILYFVVLFLQSDFLNISELVPVILCLGFLQVFHLLNLWHLILLFFLSSFELSYHLMTKFLDYLTLILIWKTKMVVISYLLFRSKPNPAHQSALFSQEWINFSAL